MHTRYPEWIDHLFYHEVTDPSLDRESVVGMVQGITLDLSNMLHSVA